MSSIVDPGERFIEQTKQMEHENRLAVLASDFSKLEGRMSKKIDEIESILNRFIDEVNFSFGKSNDTILSLQKRIEAKENKCDIRLDLPPAGVFEAGSKIMIKNDSDSDLVIGVSKEKEAHSYNILTDKLKDEK